MSVPVRNRKLSPIEFIHNFNKMRDYATDMLNTVKVRKEYDWLVSYWRSEMRWLLRKLGTAIEIANSVYVETINDQMEKVFNMKIVKWLISLLQHQQ